MDKEYTVGPYKVRIVEKGDHYGLDDALKHTERKPMIEFFLNNGYFVSRYYLETLLQDKRLLEDGLCLEGGPPEYNINALHLKDALDRAKKVVKHG